MAKGKDTEGTGCGIWPVIVRGWPSKQCDVHDKFYTQESWAQKNISRARADQHFLDMLLDASGSHIGKRALSYTMYGISRTLGWIWWEGKE